MAHAWGEVYSKKCVCRGGPEGGFGARPRANSLPAKPFAAAIARCHPVLEFASVRAGVNSRRQRQWQMGECDVTPETVDKVLTKLGLHWWDVWDEDTVREHLFTVTSYRMEDKHDVRYGRYRRVRVVTRTREYMDLGTDFYELRRIQRVIEGEHAREAA